MSRRRRAPRSPKLLKLAVLTVLAALAVFLAVRLISGAVRLAKTDGGAVTRDPQFAEPTQGVTRPPELMGEEPAATDQEDPSASWDLGEQTPVDKTAEELSREAEAEGQG